MTLKSALKRGLRKTLMALKWDLTKNLEYDRLTNLILRKEIAPHFNCVDVGCHQGEILDTLLRLAPKGKHFAFEPLPQYYSLLVRNYSHKAEIYPYALSHTGGQSVFHFVRNAPAYSGLMRRRYDLAKPEIEEIKVEVRRLDDVIPRELNIHFIKIDVEGGEMGVLLGGLETLRRSKPLILFEFGKGASDFYGYSSQDIYALLTEKIGLFIYTLKDFLQRNKPLPFKKFEGFYNNNSEYYFIASAYNYAI